MAKKVAAKVVESKPLPKKELKVTPKKEKKHYLPKLLLLYGFFLIALAVVNYYRYLAIDSRIIDAILLFSGLWIVKMALAKGSYNRRKDIVMKYI